MKLVFASNNQNKINEIKCHYRSVDRLLIDDIQFFAGKERSQEEFFHTFNALLDSQQQIILTSDRYPKEVAGLEERLKSRFGWGLTVAIEPPELETSVAILISKATAEGVDLPGEMPLPDPADCGIAAHLSQGVDAVGQEQRARAGTGRGQGRLRAGVAAADHDHIESSGKVHAPRCLSERRKGALFYARRGRHGSRPDRMGPAASIGALARAFISELEDGTRAHVMPYLPDEMQAVPRANVEFMAIQDAWFSGSMNYVGRARREDGTGYTEAEQQQMHVTMQTLGRMAIVGGGALVAGVGGGREKGLCYETM